MHIYWAAKLPYGNGSNAFGCDDGAYGAIRDLAMVMQIEGVWKFSKPDGMGWRGSYATEQDAQEAALAEPQNSQPALEDLPPRAKPKITIGALVQAAESAYAKTHPSAPTPLADFAAAIRHECDNAPGSLSRWAMAEALEQIAEELKNTAAERD